MEITKKSFYLCLNGIIYYFENYFYIDVLHLCLHKYIKPITLI